jgi:phage host-nuclease inhibitor protein Gam
MSAKKTTTKVRVEIPKLGSFDAMEKCTADLQRATILRDQVNLALDEQLNIVRTKFMIEQGETLNELNAEIALEEKLLCTWARENPDAFVGKQSLDTKFATLKWFKGQPAIRLKSKWDEADVLQRIKDCELTERFIRKIEELNRAALLEARDEVIRSTEGEFTLGDLGLRVHQQETFTIVVKVEPTPAPATAVLEETR